MDVKPAFGYRRHLVYEDGTILGVLGKPMKPRWNKRVRYWMIKLRPDDGVGPSHLTYVHKVVCEAFHGAKPEGLQARHLNGNRDDNSASNLKWGTPKENGKDMVRHGNSRLGKKHSPETIAKLTGRALSEKHKRKLSELRKGQPSNNRALCDEDVLEIRALLAEGEPHSKIAYVYGVSRGTISHIAQGRSYASVP